MYFDSPGPVNSQKTAEIAVREAMSRNIAYILVASNSGKTAELLADEAEKAGYQGQLVCISHAYGFVEDGKNELSDEGKASLESRGFRVYTSSHALSGAERAMSRAFKGAYPVEIVAYALRMLGQGLKVCVEIAVMALDGGIVPHGMPIIALGGTGRGADTAALLSPAHAHNLFQTRIHEILCKPDLISRS